MADYPFGMFEPRVLENKPGFPYDPDDLTVLFAEDYNATSDEIKRIEKYLGEYPVPSETIPQNVLSQLILDKLNTWESFANISPSIPGTFPAGSAIPSSVHLPLPSNACIATLGGGLFGIRVGGVTTTYKVFVTYEFALPNNHTLWFSYQNSATRAWVAPPSVAVGNTITGYPVVNWRLFNPITYTHV